MTEVASTLIENGHSEWVMLQVYLSLGLTRDRWPKQNSFSLDHNILTYVVNFTLMRMISGSLLV